MLYHNKREKYVPYLARSAKQAASSEDSSVLFATGIIMFLVRKTSHISSLFWHIGITTRLQKTGISNAFAQLAFDNNKKEHPIHKSNT